MWAPRGDPRLDRVRKHEYWTGLSAWLFSSLAAVDHLIAEGERAGLDGKMLITWLQGRLNKRGK